MVFEFPICLAISRYTHRPWANDSVAVRPPEGWRSPVRLRSRVSAGGTREREARRPRRIAVFLTGRALSFEDAYAGIDEREFVAAQSE